MEVGLKKNELIDFEFWTMMCHSGSWESNVSQMGGTNLIKQILPLRKAPPSKVCRLNRMPPHLYELSRISGLDISM